MIMMIIIIRNEDDQMMFSRNFQIQQNALKADNILAQNAQSTLLPQIVMQAAIF